MEFDEIETKINREIENGKIAGLKDKYGKIKIANGTIMINNRITIRNVYEIYKINNTLWINENTISLNDIEDFLILGI